MFLGIVVLLFIGCGIEENKQESDVRKISSEVRLMGRGMNLRTEEGDIKESGKVYEDAVIEFQDPVVEEMLRNMIGKTEGEVYISELQKIHAIYWQESAGYWSNLQSSEGYVPRGEGVQGPWETKQPDNLEDLTYCYNLQLMEFGRGIKVPSLEPLYDLPQLERLGFWGADVTEEVLREVSELSRLKSISFGKMELSSLEAISNLSQVEELIFEGTTLTEEILIEIGKLPMLKRLEIGKSAGTQWGHLTDGSFLIPVAAQLIELHAAGDIEWEPEVLALMTKMETLSIDYVDDLSFLGQMPELKKLSLYCCCPMSWKFLENLENLEHLEIRGNYKAKIDIELTDLCSLTNLDYLELGYTSINDEYSREDIIEALPSLTGLVTQY